MRSWILENSPVLMPFTFLMSSMDLNFPCSLRYSMMAWALVGPIPGRASNSSAVAVLMLIFCPGASVAPDLPVEADGDDDFSDEDPCLFTLEELAVAPLPSSGAPWAFSLLADFCFFEVASFGGSAAAAAAEPKVMLSLMASIFD